MHVAGGRLIPSEFDLAAASQNDRVLDSSPCFLEQLPELLVERVVGRETNATRSTNNLSCALDVVGCIFELCRRCDDCEAGDQREVDELVFSHAEFGKTFRLLEPSEGLVLPVERYDHNGGTEQEACDGADDCVTEVLTVERDGLRRSGVQCRLHLHSLACEVGLQPAQNVISSVGACFMLVESYQWKSTRCAIT